MIGEPFNILPTTDSTNNHAMNEARLGQTSDGAAYFALDQYQGKGQRDKTWNSKPGENIILSVVKDCSGFHLNNQFQLSVAVALACFDFFSAYAGDETRIKWPNDIYWLFYARRRSGGVVLLFSFEATFADMIHDVREWSSDDESDETAHPFASRRVYDI